MKGEIPLKCVICGVDFPDGSAFCPFCGSAATTSQTPLVPEPVIDQPQPEFQPTPGVQPSPPDIPENKPPKKRWVPGHVARIFLRIGTVLLSILLSLSLLMTIFVIDFKMLTNESTVERVIDSVLRDSPEGQLMMLAKGSSDDDSASQLQDALVDLIYDALKKNDDGNKITATKDQISEFLARSDSDKFLSDKLTGLMSDLINGTEETHIRSKDVIKLLENNEDLAQEIFGKDVNAKMKEDIRRFIDEHDIDRVIHKEIFPKIREANLGGILSISGVLDMVQTLTSPMALVLLILLDIILIGLLLLTNWMRIWATMRSVGTCFTTIGCLVAIPTLLIQIIPLPLPEKILTFLRLPVSVVAPVHYIVLGVGILLTIGSFIVRIFERKPRQ